MKAAIAAVMILHFLERPAKGLQVLPFAMMMSSGEFRAGVRRNVLDMARTAPRVFPIEIKK
jgi:hypothetical protein